MQWRNIDENGKQTTIALESKTWQVIDALSNNHWHEWVYSKLKARPAGSTKAGWLRSVAIDECSKLIID